MSLQLATRLACGIGAPIDDIAAAFKLPSFFSNPYKVLRQVWGQIQGRTWDAAMTSASLRAQSGNWIAKDLASKNDLITLLVSSAVNAKLIADAGNLEIANDLSRTWVIISRRMGLGGTKADVDKVKKQAMLTGNVEIGLPVIIVAVIAEAIIVVGVVAVLVYFASQVIDDVLSKIVCDRELVRLHSEFNKIVEKHTNDPNLAWSQDDKDTRDKLLEQQRFVAAGCTKPKPPFEPWPYVAGAGLLTMTVLGVVYRREIGDWFSRRR